MKNAVMIGRFQPIHLGHLEAVKESLEKCDKLTIFLTAANRPRTSENPFLIEERRIMIEEALIDFFEDRSKIPKGWTDKPKKFQILDKVQIVPIRDLYYRDQRWANEVVAEAVGIGIPEAASTKLITSLNHPIKELKRLFPNWGEFTTQEFHGGLRSEEIRESFFKKEPFKNYVTPSVSDYLDTFIVRNHEEFVNLKTGYEFEKSYKDSWSAAPFPPIHNTVDNVVLCNGTLLLIKRKFNPGKGLWALPGGFIKSNLTVLESALAELDEETKIRVPEKQLIGSLEKVKVFDHPKRDPRGRVITNVHFYNLTAKTLPSVQGSDDAEEARWIPLHQVWSMSNKMFRDHWDIIDQMVAGY